MQIMINIKVIISLLLSFLLGNSINNQGNKLTHDLCDKPHEILDYFNKGQQVMKLEILNSESFESKNPNVDNYANTIVETSMGWMDLSSIYSNEVGSAVNEGMPAKAIISDNNSFCEEDLLGIHKDTKENFMFSIFVHIWNNPDTLKSDTLVINYNYAYR